MVSVEIGSRLKEIKKLVLQVIPTTTTKKGKLVLYYIILLVIEGQEVFRSITSNTSFRGWVHG
jgi:hypothetical protein